MENKLILDFRIAERVEIGCLGKTNIGHSEDSIVGDLEIDGQLVIFRTGFCWS